MRLRKKKSVHLYNQLKHKGGRVDLPVYKGTIRGAGIKSVFKSIFNVAKQKLPGLAKEIGKEVGTNVIRGVIRGQKPGQALKSALKNKKVLAKSLDLSKAAFKSGMNEINKKKTKKPRVGIRMKKNKRRQKGRGISHTKKIKLKRLRHNILEN